MTEKERQEKYDFLVKNDLPRWVVIDLTTSTVIAVEWSWTYADIAAYKAEQEFYMHSIRIYDRMDEIDAKMLDDFLQRK
jgi:hypothetical protein